MKPGYKTSEFWLSLAPWIMALAALGLVAAGVIDIDRAWAIITALGVGGSYASGRYSEARAKIKSNGG